MIRPVTARPKQFLAGLLLLASVFVLVRGPLHAVTFSLPVSNDDAILLLMARHILKGELATILWNQPYNGALDAYLLAPGLALGPHHLVFRLYELLCAALLVSLAGLLARRVAGVAAGWAAAALAAWGTPYMGLKTATGPPPNFLMPLVTGFPLLVALRGLERDATPTSARLWFVAGLVYGLGVWNSSLAIPAFAGMAGGLLGAGLRPRRLTVVFLGGLVLGASPLAVARAIGASGSTVVTAASAVTAMRPRWLWLSGLSDLGHADADGARRHLAQRDLGALVRLGVGAELLAGGLHVGGHLPDIALEAIEVEQQRGGRQLGARHGSVRIPLGLGTGSSCEAEQIGRGRRASGTP